MICCQKYSYGIKLGENCEKVGNPHANLNKYKSYVENQWIYNSNIKHNELSVYGAHIATNNNHESFNKILNEEFERKSPNPWDFVLSREF